MSRRWQIRKVDRGHLFRLTREVSLPTAVARVLMNRGIFTPSEAQEFLSPSLRWLERVKELPGLDKAVSLLDRMVRENGRILVFGDYDVDGLTGSALLFRFLKSLSAQVEVYIPNRFTEGYGVTEQAARNILRDSPPHLLITVDCGIRDQEGLDLLRSKGVSLIVTDHHLPDFAALPEVDALVCNFDLGTQELLFPLAGVGVALALAYRYAEYRGLKVNPLEEYVGLAGLGTVADAVPLLGVNRVIAWYGLQKLNQKPPLGLRALWKMLGFEGREMGAEDLGCIIAPRLNAAGRMESSWPALRLLLSENWEEVIQISHYLQELNVRRQREAERILLEITENPEQNQYFGDEVVVVSGPNWSLGVLGIIASRLSRSLNRPVIVLSEQEKIATGSGRSVEGFNLLQMLERARSFLIRYGGHEMAVGLRMPRESVAAFRKFVNTSYGRKIQKSAPVQGLVVDALVDFKEVDGRFLKWLKKLEPFGEQHPNPLFAALNVSLVKSWVFGKSKNHLRFLVKQGREMQEIVVYDGKDKASDLNESSLVDLAFEIQHHNSLSYPYLKAHDWRIKK
ncbi:MAG: single-stranded-DNA-specific exonuclease RecJ [Candidatus Caldatribacteriaceae bacterium]